MESQLLISGKYRVTKLVGRGTFGDVYQGMNEETLEEVAIKTEDLAHKQPQIVSEGFILRDLQQIEGVPKLYWAGRSGSHNLLVMELLGPSLEDLLTLCGRCMSLSSVMQLADQMLRRCECVHARGYVHRDIKPDNYLMGLSPHDSLLYMIDFGLAKRYKDEVTHEHIAFQEGKGLMGTARYASINSHLGLELSRRDDLESIAYVLIYLSIGKLPWQGIAKQSKNEKHALILQVKQNTSADTLCKGLPLEFIQFLTYVRSLRFDEKPDYVYLRRLIHAVKMRRRLQFDGHFEWKPKLKNPPRSYSASQLSKPRRAKTRLRTKFEVLPRSQTTKSKPDCLSTQNGSDTRCGMDFLPAFTAKTREAISKYRGRTQETKMCALW